MKVGGAVRPFRKNGNVLGRRWRLESRAPAYEPAEDFRRVHQDLTNQSADVQVRIEIVLEGYRSAMEGGVSAD